MLFLFSWVLLFWQASAEELSLENYLQMVKEGNLSYKAAQFKKNGFEQSRGEANVFFRPQLHGQALLDSNASYPSQPGFGYDEIRTNIYQLGISQDFDFGLQMQLNYQLSKIQFFNASFGGTPIEFNNWNAVPRVDIQLPLWQNLFARSTRAQRDIVRSQNEAEMQAARLQEIEVLLNSQLAYWRLSTAQKVVNIQRESYARAKELFQFVQKKARLDLREKSDVLQSKAAYSASDLDLKMALDEEKLAQREFNRWRGAEASAPIPQLSSIQKESLKHETLPQKRPGERLDVTIAKAQLNMARANAIVSEERNKPSLALVGSYAMNGRDNTSLSSSISDVNRSDRNSYSYGVQFNVPLNLSATSDARSGARLRQQAAETEVEHRLFDQDQQWIDLRARHKEAIDRLDLVQQISQAQKDKLFEERRLLRLGRSSLFNVINFEQDSLRADKMLAQSILEIRNLELQSQLYGGGKE